MPAILEKLTSGELPAFELSGGGLIMLLLAFKLARGALRVVFIIIAVGLVAAGIWWYWQRHH